MVVARSRFRSLLILHFTTSQCSLESSRRSFTPWFGSRISHGHTRQPSRSRAPSCDLGAGESESRVSRVSAVEWGGRKVKDTTVNSKVKAMKKAYLCASKSCDSHVTYYSIVRIAESTTHATCDNICFACWLGV